MLRLTKTEYRNNKKFSEKILARGEEDYLKDKIKFFVNDYIEFCESNKIEYKVCKSKKGIEIVIESSQIKWLYEIKN